MPSSPLVNGRDGLRFGPDPTLVHDQLKRLVTHPLFTNSKRYPVLLTYIVEQTLLGNSSELKERTIGVEALGRETDYDVNLDPVVRATAAEVRKRLSQYYYNPDHAEELVFELPVGSYVPCFRAPASHSIAVTALVPAEVVDASPAETAPSQHQPVDSKIHAGAPTLVGWLPIAIGMVVVACVAFLAGRLGWPVGANRAAGPSNMARFWQPITTASGRITYCLGVPVDFLDLQSRTVPDIPAHESGSLNAYDVVTLARAIAPLVPQNGQFRVLAASDTGFAQLREGPFVLIGAFDNPWTMRITQDLPIGFETENQIRSIVDRSTVPKRAWTIQWQVPGRSLARDYAVVARLHDKVTGEPVIILAGILGEGTEAASEVVSNPAYLDAVLKKAPSDWDQRNLEAVIEANVIEGHPGPPTVVAVKIW